MAHNAEHFREELESILTQARSLGLAIVGIRAGDLHRRVGGYPGPDHRMPVCCQVMRAAMKARDEILEAPPKGDGASLLVLYRLTGG